MMDIGAYAYKAGNHFIRSCNKAFGLRPTSWPYISGDSFRSLADHRLERGRGFDNGLFAGSYLYLLLRLDRRRHYIYVVNARRYF